MAWKWSKRYFVLFQNKVQYYKVMKLQFLWGFFFIIPCTCQLLLSLQPKMPPVNIVFFFQSPVDDSPAGEIMLPGGTIIMEEPENIAVMGMTNVFSIQGRSSSALSRCFALSCHPVSCVLVGSVGRSRRAQVLHLWFHEGG